MRILFAASEVSGFAKTGGLADVVASLPQALAQRGHECLVILPLYQACRRSKQSIEPTDHYVEVPLPGRSIWGRLWRSSLGEGAVRVPVILIEQDRYFDRDDARQGRGLYQHALPNQAKVDYADNCERFSFFCRAVLESLPKLGFWPDVLHANDWQTGLLPALRKELYPHGEYQRIRSLLTIHNIAYQGLFWRYDLPLTGLSWKLFTSQQLEYYQQISFLKAGIVWADLINTVSPTYAKEMQTPAFGCGLQGLLSERKASVYGIVNGVDFTVWNPETDAHLPRNYNADTVLEGKAACKQAVQERFQLQASPRAPLLGMIARLVAQKGVDLVCQAVPQLLQQGCQLVVLGEGDPRYQRDLQELQRRSPTQLGLYLGFDEGLAHQIEAGSDMFLMPSSYEPSGLNQLYSMRYGTPPIVRTTGGLADTVVDTNPVTFGNRTATGFRFQSYLAEDLIGATLRAVDMYRSAPEHWLQVVRNGMRQDWSWAHSAAEYETLYGLLAAHR